MVDEPANIVLRYLRQLDDKLDKLDGRQQEMTAELRLLKTPMSAFMQRLEKIERRLDLNN
ncbi:MAG: hypothetical protein R3D89_13680 [Sphingomonadaceae bacterium]